MAQDLKPIQYKVPGLATVVVDQWGVGDAPVVIRLDPFYKGELNNNGTAIFPDGVYLRCTDASAVHNEKLHMFLEILYQWDSTGDQVPDHFDVVEAIQYALYLGSDEICKFERPNTGWFTRLVGKMLPPAPDYQIVLGFGDLKQQFRLRHYLGAVPLLLVFLGLVQLQIHFLPWTQYSVVTGFWALIKHAGLPTWAQYMLFGLAVGFLSQRMFGKRKAPKDSHPSPLSMHTTGLFSRSAVLEEQWFREGAQDWTLWQRVRSCIAFGVIHMANLIYLVATILPLALGGALFMFVYLQTFKKTHFRRTAVLEAALWHRVYNRVALFSVLLVVVMSFGGWALSSLAMVAGLAVVLGANYVHYRIHLRRHNRHFDVSVEEVAPVPAFQQ